MIEHLLPRRLEKTPYPVLGKTRLSISQHLSEKPHVNSYVVKHKLFEAGSTFTWSNGLFGPTESGSNILPAIILCDGRVTFVPIIPACFRATYARYGSPAAKELFDSERFIYELKIDGFRALAHIQNGE